MQLVATSSTQSNKFRTRARQQQAGLLGGQLGEQYRTLGLLSGIGGQQQALEQARLEAQRAEFDRELDFPLRQLEYYKQHQDKYLLRLLDKERKKKLV